MSEETLKSAAEKLAKAWGDRTTIDFPSDLLPKNRGEAYSIQDKMAQIISADSANATVGWKVGATSRGVREAMGFDGPIPGRIFASTVYQSPAQVPPDLCQHSNLEAEIAFGISGELDPQGHPFTNEYLAEQVSLYIAYELTGSRFNPDTRKDWDNNQNTLATIADNGSSGAIVVGAEVADWGGLGLMDLKVGLSINGGEEIENMFGEFRGDPFEGLVWTINSVYERGYQLQKGDYIMTGSLTKPQPLQKGDKAVAAYPGISEISVDFS